MVVNSLSPKWRRWLPWGLALALSVAGGVAWYLHHAEQQALADRAMSEIPKEEYEQWMQELGYTD